MNKTKLFLLVVTLSAFISCDSSSNKKQEFVSLKIENYLETVQNKFPNYNTNSAIKDELNEYLKSDFKKSIDTGLISDLPFKLEKVEKCGKKYVLNLEHSLTSKFYDRDILSDLELDLYALTDENTAKSLQEGQFYLIDVEFKEYITFQNNEKYCALVLMSPFIGYLDNEIQFGAVGVNLKRIKKFTN